MQDRRPARKGKVKAYRAVFARTGGTMPSEGVSDGIFRGEMLQFAPFLPTQGNRIMFTGIVPPVRTKTARYA
ncbi:TPA: riboflavin synthase, partial [Neisseria gonorrhoeae]